MYSKTCLKRPLTEETKIGFHDPLSVNAGSKVLQNAPREHSAIVSSFIKIPLSLKPLICLILSGRLRQVLLYYTPPQFLHNLLSGNHLIACLYKQSGKH